LCWRSPIGSFEMMVEVVSGRGNRHVLQGGSLPKKVRFGLAGAVKDEDSLGLSLCALLESGIYLAAGLFTACDGSPIVS
jgi:hypothetical protein